MSIEFKGDVSASYEFLSTSLAHCMGLIPIGISSKTTKTTYIKATERREAYSYVAFANVVTAKLTAAAVVFFYLRGIQFKVRFYLKIIQSRLGAPKVRPPVKKGPFL